MDFCRDFVANNYFPVKEQHPYFPFLVRECEEADPIIVARYSIEYIERTGFKSA